MYTTIQTLAKTATIPVEGVSVLCKIGGHLLEGTIHKYTPKNKIMVDIASRGIETLEASSVYFKN
ncbi:hypothetical protein VP150E351_P0226 [Vibrio phage 150E35-1]|nr:hypothetical protein VP150E351_P0226 [Vibrio phage 150E35-1]